MTKYFSSIIICFLSLFIFLGCSKDLSYENGVAPPLAVSANGTLKDSSGNCLPITVVGNYYSNYATNDSNYVQITVNVSSTGSYNIQTGIQNGFQFAGTGVFNTTGIQMINLKASGTPTQTATTNFSVTFGSTTCDFSVNVKDTTVNNGGGTDTSTIALNSWKFVANSHTYAGNIVNASFTNLIGANLVLTGTMASGSIDTAFSMSIEFSGTTLDTGTFVTSGAGTNFSLALTQSGNIIYAANATAVPPVLNITVSSYNATTKIVSGIFSGQAYDANGNNLAITNGEFKASVQ